MQDNNTTTTTAGDSYQKLSDQELEGEAKKLKGWKIVDGRLNRSFEFKNFVQAFGF